MTHVAWIRTTSLLATLGWLATGCGTSSASAVAPTKAPQSAASTVGAPHVFTPRSHPPRVHELPPPPDLAALPPMVDRIHTCFAAEVEEETGGWAPPPRGHRSTKKTKRPPPGFVPYGGGGGTTTGASKPKKEARGRTSGGSKSADAFGGSLGAGPGPGEAIPSVPPSPKPQSAPVVKDAEAKNAGGNRPLAPLAAEEAPAIATDRDDGYHDWGASIYLSNDDTMSLSSAQRVIFAIDGFLPLPAEHIRPHELLNYFSFDTAPVGAENDFSVEASIAPDPEQEGIYSLAMAVRGRPLALEERRNANLSLVIDRSGSMSAEGRMTYLRRGLEQMTSQLKTGDMVHLVLFDHEVCTAVENFVVGRDQPSVLTEAVRRLEPRGSTDLHLGLTEGYALADRTYRPTYTNRVVMITDAIANTGVTDEQLIATVGKYYDERRIRLSGVGVGREFNDSLLDELTERGKGAYVFLGSEAEVDAVFGPRFISLVETTALDVHFQLHLPPSLRMNVFYGEESSTVKEDVQAIHYFANTSQLFLSDLMARGGQDGGGGQNGGKLREQDQVMLTIEYEDPESGDDRVEEYAFTLGEIAEADRNVRKGRLVMHFVDGLAWMAARPVPSAWGSRGDSWEDGEAWDACQDGRRELATLAKGLEEDPEVRRVTELWDRYCSRYSQPREPVRRAPPTEGWPSASGR